MPHNLENSSNLTSTKFSSNSSTTDKILPYMPTITRLNNEEEDNAGVGASTTTTTTEERERAAIRESTRIVDGAPSTSSLGDVSEEEEEEGEGAVKTNTTGVPAGRGNSKVQQGNVGNCLQTEIQTPETNKPIVDASQFSNSLLSPSQWQANNLPRQTSETNKVLNASRFNNPSRRQATNFPRQNQTQTLETSKIVNFSQFNNISINPSHWQANNFPTINQMQTPEPNKVVDASQFSNFSMNPSQRQANNSL